MVPMSFLLAYFTVAIYICGHYKKCKTFIICYWFFLIKLTITIGETYHDFVFTKCHVKVSWKENETINI